ncbi:MAG: hypothetical protein O2962_07465, partial [Cyanobacteria bacterium]|nr:hypothetical protein [Cyanobacteriota bacterium]
GRADFRKMPVRSSTVTVEATGDNNTVIIDKDFTGTVLIKDPNNVKVELVDGSKVEADQTLYFKNGKVVENKLGIIDGLEIPKPPAPNAPKPKLILL